MPVAGSYEQHAAVEAAAVWTASQAERLGVSTDEVLSTVRAGWTAWDIERLSAANAGELTGPAPRPGYLVVALRKIREAPVLPLRLDFETRKRLRR